MVGPLLVERQCHFHLRDSGPESQLERLPYAVSEGTQSMIDPHDFAQKQLELTEEFGKYVMSHPEVDDLLPPESYLYFEIAGEEEFNRYSRQLAEKQFQEDGLPLVCVKIKGLAPPQGTRLIEPVIESTPAGV
jgi:hypothetical protein